jgi:transcriptional regulator with XRE-family HTH domain
MHMTFRKDFPNLLKLARSQAGLSQVALAGKCSITQDWISHFECGRRLPNLETFFTLVRALGVSADWFITKTPKTQPTKGK